MRLIELDRLEEGMELGKTIYAPNGQILLKKGVILRPALIYCIKKLKIPFVYIEDEFSKEINFEDIVDEQLKHRTVQKIKGFFTSALPSGDSKTISDALKSIDFLLADMMDQIVNNKGMIVNLIDLKSYDDYTFKHSVNVTALSCVIGVALNYNRKQLTYLAKGALFHDIGKMFLEKDILNKPGKLTEDEFNHVKKHTLFGHEFALKNLNLKYESLTAILHHHEKFNGEGYPYGKKGTDIHLNAQIVAICDVFDAITSKRIYNKPVLPSEAMEYIMGSSGQHFNPEVVNVFLRKVAVYPLGITVELSNGVKGLVCENYEGYIMRPKIKVITENLNDNVYINLKDIENSAVTIVKVIH